MARRRSLAFRATRPSSSPISWRPRATSEPMSKPEVRAVAARMGLSVAAKADSQDICFVPHGKYSDIIASLKPNAASPGDIVHLDGRVLGRHDGILRFTIGQRRGIGVASGEPLYVVHIDAERARVV